MEGVLQVPCWRDGKSQIEAVIASWCLASFAPSNFLQRHQARFQLRGCENRRIGPQEMFGGPQKKESMLFCVEACNMQGPTLFPLRPPCHSACSVPCWECLDPQPVEQWIPGCRFRGPLQNAGSPFGSS